MHTKNEQKRANKQFFLKKITKTLANSKIMPTFASLSTANLIGRLAQLVQSICLTSRGSAVRIRQRPPIFLHHGGLYKERLPLIASKFAAQSRIYHEGV